MESYPIDHKLLHFPMNSIILYAKVIGLYSQNGWCTTPLQKVESRYTVLLQRDNNKKKRAH